MKRLRTACLAMVLALALTLALTLAFSLGLWGGERPGATTPGPSPTPSSEPAPVLAFFGTSTQPWCQSFRDGAADWCQREGWELLEYDCLGLESTQAIQVADLAYTQGADLAVLCALDGQESLAANVAALADRGTRVITLSGSPLDHPVPEGSLCHLRPYSADMLRAAAAFFQGELGENTGVVILHDMETAPLELAARSTLEEGGVRVAEETYTWGSVDFAQMFLTDVLARHGDVGGVLTFSRTGAQGARAALEEAGRLGEVKVLCLGGSQELLDDLEHGELDGLVTLAPQGADELDKALTQAAQGKSPTGGALSVEARRAGV